MTACVTIATMIRGATKYLVGLAAGLTVVGLAATPVKAEDPLQAAGIYDEGRAHFKAATEAEKAGDSDTALREYALAYKLSKDPKLFYNLAKVSEVAGRSEEAAIFYRRYLKEATVADAARQEVMDKLAMLEGTPLPGAEGSGQDQALEGSSSAASAASAASPAETATTAAPAESGDSAAGAGAGAGASGTGEGEAVDPLLAILGEDTVTEVEALPPAPITRFRPRWQTTAAWASVGVSAALLAAGGVISTSAVARGDDMKRLGRQTDPETGLPLKYEGTVKSQYENAEDEGQFFGRLSTLVFLGAGLAACSAIVFFVVDQPIEQAEKAPAPEEESIVWHFQPMIVPHGGGLSASWGF
ncbi:MAG: hypothetical protein V2A73_03035 [Pseudomonadota bacterium]